MSAIDRRCDPVVDLGDMVEDFQSRDDGAKYNDKCNQNTSLEIAWPPSVLRILFILCRVPLSKFLLAVKYKTLVGFEWKRLVRDGSRLLCQAQLFRGALTVKGNFRPFFSVLSI
jgi:hypothetical protein